MKPNGRVPASSAQDLNLVLSTANTVGLSNADLCGYLTVPLSTLLGGVCLPFRVSYSNGSSQLSELRFSSHCPSSTGSSLWFILSPSLESKKGSAGFVPCCFCLTQGVPSRERQRDSEREGGREEEKERERYCVCVVCVPPKPLDLSNTTGSQDPSYL